MVILDEMKLGANELQGIVSVLQLLAPYLMMMNTELENMFLKQWEGQSLTVAIIIRPTTCATYMEELQRQSLYAHRPTTRIFYARGAESTFKSISTVAIHPDMSSILMSHRGTIKELAKRKLVQRCHLALLIFWLD